MILNSKVIVNVIKIKKHFYFLLINNVISTLDFVKILTYYIDDKKI